MKGIEKVKQLAKENPIWLSILIVAATAALTAANIFLSGLNLGWW